MSGIVRTMATAAGLFAGTNIDDLAVLAVLFMSSRATGSIRRWQIWAGQATGFSALVVVSLLAALGLSVVPGGLLGLLGLIPLALGLLSLARAVWARRSGEPVPVAPATGLVSVAALTIVNGADNLTVYPPVFRTVGAGAALVTIAVFAAGVALWCLLGSLLGSRRGAVTLVERWGHWIVPTVFVAIGAVMLAGA